MLTHMLEIELCLLKRSTKPQEDSIYNPGSNVVECETDYGLYGFHLQLFHIIAKDIILPYFQEAQHASLEVYVVIS